MESLNLQKIISTDLLNRFYRPGPPIEPKFGVESVKNTFGEVLPKSF